MPTDGTTTTTTGTSEQSAVAQQKQCWFCESRASAACRCGRAFCSYHSESGFCMLCALGFGLYERKGEAEPVSGLILLSMAVASGDPYIVVPPALQYNRPMPIANVEGVVGVLIKMLAHGNDDMRRHAVTALASTTAYWPSMNPSPLAKRDYGVSLLAADPVRRWILHTLKASRGLKYEKTALAVLDKLQQADFRDLYPSVQAEFIQLKSSPLMIRVRETFDMIGEFYPTQSQLVNERCELMTYTHYVDRKSGVGATMERIYGPLLKYSPVLSKVLKRGTWLKSQARYEEWYFGEREPI